MSCSGTTRKGKPCRAAPLKGRDVCLAHADADTRGSTGFTAEAGHLGGRPRLPRPSEVARRLVEENVLVLLRPYFATLGYDVQHGDDGPELVALDGGGAKLHASWRGDVEVSPHDDLAAMREAAERLLDRVYGKPRQALEHTGADGGPIEVGEQVDLSKLSLDQLKTLRELLASARRESEDPR